MDDQLLHDPQTKKQIKEALYLFLYSPVLKQFAKRIDDLVANNSMLLSSVESSFIYKNVTYCATGASLTRRVSNLHKQLHVYMDQYLTDIDQLNNYELPRVLGFINQVLNASNDLQDYLSVLPSSMHPPVERLILSCPCRNKKLTLDKITTLQLSNQVPIDLMKQRLILNLLL